MGIMRLLVCALALSLLSSLAGCGRGPEKSVEELETEDVRNERRKLHQKKFQNAPPADSGPQSK